MKERIKNESQAGRTIAALSVHDVWVYRRNRYIRWGVGMDRLSKYVEALRALARQPEGNRLLVAEQQINDFIRPNIDALRKSLESIRDAAQAEAAISPNDFWNADVLAYVDALLDRVSGLLETHLPTD